MPNDTAFKSIAHNSQGDVYATTNAKLFRSTDNGLNWMHVGTPANSSYMVYVDSRDYVFIPDTTYIRCSKDGGDTWDTIDAVERGFRIRLVKENMIILDRWHGIYKSDDFGNTWSHVHQDYTNTRHVTSLIDAGDGVLFAGILGWMGGGGVYRSDDNGDNWVHVGLDDDYVNALAMDSKGTIYAGSHGNYLTYSGGVYKSEDMGNTWECLNNSLSVMSLVIDKNDVLYVGNYYEYGPSGIFRSTDGGHQWERIVSGMSNPRVTQLSLSPEGYLYAFEDKLFYRSAEPIPTGIADNSAIPLQVGPNPFIDKLHIGGFAANSATLSVCDTWGREVHRQQYTGEPINLSRLPAGVYLLRVEADGQRGVHKIVKK